MLQIKNFYIAVEKKKIKNMYLRILPPNGQIHVSAPIRMKESEIEHFILSKEDWIEKQVRKIQGNNSIQIFQYETGDMIPLLGRNYLLSVEITNKQRLVLIQEDQLILRVRETDTVSVREKLIFEWYHKELSTRIPYLLEKWESVLGVSSSSFYLRNMKTRWGTCNVRNKRICFNLQLAKKPPKCLEYVVVHELVHLLERSHNQVFKNYMDRFLPDWRDRKKQLNGL